MKPTLLITFSWVAATFLTPSALLAADAARVVGDLTVTGLAFTADPGTVITNPLQMGPWGLITPQGSNTNVFFGLTGGNVGIGTATPSEQLELTGNLNLPATTAVAGQIRQGGSTLLHTYGSQNTFVGNAAGNPTKLTGYENTGVGFATLYNNSSGSSNTATGSGALNLNTTGGRNTAIGTGALTKSTVGNDNTACGSNTLMNNISGNNNAALGIYALAYNKNGNENTAVGYAALNFNDSGIGNTAVGATTGGTTMFTGNMTGSYNTYLGHSAGPGTSTQLNKSTAIGYNARVSQDKSMVLGGTGADAVMVGIGTTTPTAQLEVVGDAKVSGAITSGTWSGTAISPAKGGTGLDSSAAATGSLLKSTSTGTWGTLSPGSEGQTLKMSGGSPVWSSTSADATSTFRVLGTPGASWPAATGMGVEIAHDSNVNKGFIQSYDRGGAGAWGTLDINASTVTIGGTPGNLAVSGTVAATGAISAPSMRIKPGLGNHGVPFTNGMIMKAVGTNTSFVAGTAVARTDQLILERDGVTGGGGWRINYPVSASPKQQSITCTGMDNSGAFRGVVKTNLAVGFTQVYLNSDNILQMTCLFGNVYNAGEITQVTLHRQDGDWYWQGFMNSTYDQ